MSAIRVFCSLIVFLLSANMCFTMDTHTRDVGVDEFDSMGPILPDNVREQFKKTIENEVSKIVSKYQRQLISQDKRIRLLEKGQMRKQFVVDKLATKIVTLEKNQERLLKLSSVCSKDTPDVENKHTLKNNYNDFQQIETQNCSDAFGKGGSGGQRGIRSGVKSGIQPYSNQRSTITENSHVAFSAYLDHEIHLYHGQVIKYNQILLNEGHGYNPYTGIFTVPSPGVYMLTFHFVGKERKNIVRLVVDGVAQVDAIIHVDAANQAQEHSAGNTVVLRLTQGQSVWSELLLDNGFMISGEGYRFCTLSGFLLYP